MPRRGRGCLAGRAGEFHGSDRGARLGGPRGFDGDRRRLPSSALAQATLRTLLMTRITLAAACGGDGCRRGRRDGSLRRVRAGGPTRSVASTDGEIATARSREDRDAIARRRSAIASKTLCTRSPRAVDPSQRCPVGRSSSRSRADRLRGRQLVDVTWHRDKAKTTSLRRYRFRPSDAHPPMRSTCSIANRIGTLLVAHRSRESINWRATPSPSV